MIQKGRLMFPNSALVFCVVFLLALLQCKAFPQETASSEKVNFQIYRTGIVNVGKMKNGQTQSQIVWLGTGFLIGADCTYATAKHLFQQKADDEIVIIRFQLPSNPGLTRIIVARILYESPEGDLTFLKIDRYNNSPCRSVQLHVFPILSEDNVELVGESVLIIGHPRLSRMSNEILSIPVLRKGFIASTEIKWTGDVPMILLDLTGVPGFSGSPVILERTGQVVGVV